MAAKASATTSTRDIEAALAHVVARSSSPSSRRRRSVNDASSSATTGALTSAASGARSAARSTNAAPAGSPASANGAARLRSVVHSWVQCPELHHGEEVREDRRRTGIEVQLAFRVGQRRGAVGVRRHSHGPAGQLAGGAEVGDREAPLGSPPLAVVPHDELGAHHGQSALSTVDDERLGGEAAGCLT
jgi:hypothetical protein